MKETRCLPSFVPLLITLALAITALAVPLEAQPPDDGAGAKVLHRNNRGMPTWVVGKLGKLDRNDLERSAKDALPALVRRHFNGIGDEEFRAIHSSSDSAGRTHLRFQQYLRDLPVVGAELNLHVESASGLVVGMNGRFVPHHDVETEPSLSAEVALALGRAEAGAVGGELVTEPTLTYVLPPDAERIHLAWTADVRYETADGEQIDRLFVDANDGALLMVMPQQSSLIRRETYTANHTTTLPGTPLACDPPPAVPLCPSSTSDPVGQTAHNNTGSVYTFHYLVFGRDSLDNHGMILRSTVHYGAGVNNSRYTGGSNPQMWYGDGDGVLFAPLGNALDVVAHEMQHGVTRFEAGGPCPGESEALHESISDFFGAAVEAWMDGGVNSNTWKEGEDVYTPAIPGDALRYLNDPALDGQSADFFPQFNYANGADPHANAGIMNLALYLLTQGGTHPRGKTSIPVTGIGMAASRQLVNDALSYLVSCARYEDMRLAMSQAAAVQYGVGSTQAVAVHDAFCAVGFNCSDTTGPVLFVDRPSHTQMISGSFSAYGWATDASGVSRMQFELDNQPITLSGFVYGTSRGDVCAAYSSLNDPNCPYVGWQGTLDANAFPSGTHVLKAIAFDAFGNTTALNRTFQSTRGATFNALADAWVNQLAPNTNYGSDTSLHVRSASTGSGNHTYLKFNVSGITAPIQSALLRIRTQGIAFPSSRVYYMVDTSWGESTITWNNASLAFNFQYPIGSLPANTWVLIDVSSIVKFNGTYTIGLVAADVPGLAFWSRESSYKPTLEITY